MSAIDDWTAGKPCERHDLAYCADCQKLAHLTRDAGGTVTYTGDCAVATLVEITGTSYAEASELLREAGFRPGKGTPADALRTVFTEAGYKVTDHTRRIRLEEAQECSKTGRQFYVEGWAGKTGHAWSITDGTANRPMPYRQYRYRLFEVTA